MRASSQIERQMANKRQTAKYTHQFAPDEQLKSHAHAHTRTCSICVWRIKALDGIKYNTCEWRLSANEHAESWRIEVFSCKWRSLSHFICLSIRRVNSGVHVDYSRVFSLTLFLKFFSYFWLYSYSSLLFSFILANKNERNIEIRKLYRIFKWIERQWRLKPLTHTQRIHYSSRVSVSVF